MLRKSGGIFIFTLSVFFAFSLSPQEDEIVLSQGSRCRWGSPDCNPCVYDVEGALDSSKKRGEVMGFLKGEYDFDPTRYNHFQGIQRMMPGNGQYLVVIYVKADTDKGFHPTKRQ